MKCETAVLQDKGELFELIVLFQREKVRSYLEIGCKFGGSLWHIGKSLPKGSRIVGVDLPRGDGSFKDSEPHLKESAAALMAKGYDVHLFLGDSTDPEIIKQVEPLGPFDACLIDGNHTVPYIAKDFENYGRMARIVALHDINHRRPHPEKKHIEVYKFWDQIKKEYRHTEIIHGTREGDKRDCGLGVLWR